MDVIRVDPFTNVGVSQRATATWRPPAPMSLHGFVFVLGGTDFDETDIDQMRVKKGGKELVPAISGANHRDLYEYEGIVYDAAHVPVMFGDVAARTFRGKHMGNFDHTVYPGDMTLEVDIGSGADAPTLEAYALIMPPKQAMGAFTDEEAALHRAYVETIIQTSAAVDQKAFDVGIGSQAGALLKRLYFVHGGDMDSLSVKRRGIDIWEDIPQALADYMQDDLYARAPQANMYVYDTMLDGDYSEIKTTMDRNGNPVNYQVRVTTSDAATITTYADILTRLSLL